MPKLTIGTYILPYGLMLAPMAGVTDHAFRRICKECGAEFTVSEMLSCDAIHYKDLKTAKLAKITKVQEPIALQIFGSDPEIMAEATAQLCSNSYRGCESEIRPAAIDINMGCPVPKVAGNGKGSALMKNPALVGEIVRAVSAASDLPVTVKIRAGWDDAHRNAVEIAEIAEKNGAAMICVHGRTREQMYHPPVDRAIIAQVKQAVSIPVIGNGGIMSGEDALRMLDETKCDGLMIARGAEGNPWIFGEIIAAIDGKKWSPPTPAERMRAAIRQLDFLVEDKGDKIGTMEARKHLAWYIKGFDGAPALRDRINRTETYPEMRAIAEELLEKAVDQL